MKDDIFKKLKTLLSGSNESHVKKIENLDKKNDKNEELDLINNFMNQILDVAWIEEDLKSTCLPSYYLCKKNKSYWLFNVTLKSFIHITSGSKITPIEQGNKTTVCLIGQGMFSVPNELIIYNGWN